MQGKAPDSVAYVAFGICLGTQLGPSSRQKGACPFSTSRALTSSSTRASNDTEGVRVTCRHKRSDV
jgi:hypothetical protein